MGSAVGEERGTGDRRRDAPLVTTASVFISTSLDSSSSSEEDSSEEDSSSDEDSYEQQERKGGKEGQVSPKFRTCVGDARRAG